MIQFHKNPDTQILELGCGFDRHPQADFAVDSRQCEANSRKLIDLVHDLTRTPWPLAAGKFDCVYAKFVLEHVSYHCVPAFLGECLRVLKPGGMVLLVIPNTEAQLRWVLDHPDGWDGKDYFHSASEKLFGSQNMPDAQGQDQNTHRCFFTPQVITQLLTSVGFSGVLTQPFGERQTDMVVQARKPDAQPPTTRPAHSGFDAGTPSANQPPPAGKPSNAAVEPNVLGTNVTRDNPLARGLLSKTLARPETIAACLDHLESLDRRPETVQPTRVLDDVEAALAHIPQTPQAAQPTAAAVKPPATLLQPAAPWAAPTPGGRPESPANAGLGEKRVGGTLFAAPPGAQVQPWPGPVATPNTPEEREEERRILEGDPNAPKPGGVIHVRGPYGGKTAAEVFNKHYFDGGRGGWGGYGGGGYMDFPVHHVIARHVLDRKPESVLELGCGRGYILKRLQDAGLKAWGIEVSRHCHLTRVCSDIWEWDLCNTPWSMRDNPVRIADGHFDLCFSIGVLDHLSENDLPAVIREMTRTCKRGLHGVDVGPKTDGDKTRLACHPVEWWQELFARHAPGWPCEVVDKTVLEKGEFPKAVLDGDGKNKVNLGSFTTCFHHGWLNVDKHDLGRWAEGGGYRYLRHDCSQGLPFTTASVDLIFAHHFLEHLDRVSAARLLKDCRRVLKPDGAMRIVVPDCSELCRRYIQRSGLADLDQLNDGCEQAPTDVGKLYAMLVPDHSMFYDEETLIRMLQEAGFEARRSSFRTCDAKGLNATCQHPRLLQLLRETVEMDFGGTSLFVDAVPMCS